MAGLPLLSVDSIKEVVEGKLNGREHMVQHQMIAFLSIEPYKNWDAGRNSYALDNCSFKSSSAGALRQAAQLRC